ncbi:MAG TPA: hypothetical protein VII22_22185 [Streptosporangiaceae bacterium]
MATSPAPRVARSQIPGTQLTIALAPAARNSLGRLQEHSSLSPADLTNCAITWYAYLDTQLRAGYDLIIRNSQTGKAHIVSFSADAPARDVRWASSKNGAHGAGSGSPAAPGYNLSTAQPSPATNPCRLYRYGLPASVTALGQARLTVAASRGSPVGAPGGGAAQPACRPATGLLHRKPAVSARNWGPS